MTILNPRTKEEWNVKDIGKGEYKIKATSNSGATRWAYVNVDNVTDRLKTPSIILDKPAPDGKNDWYITPVKITIDKGENNPLVKKIKYRLLKEGLAITPEEGAEYTSTFTISEVGTYTIYAWVEDGEITVVASDPKGILAGYTYEVYDLQNNNKYDNNSKSI